MKTTITGSQCKRRDHMGLTDFTHVCEVNFSFLFLLFFDFAAAGVKCRVGAVKSLPLFIFLGITEPSLISWKTELRLTHLRLNIFNKLSHHELWKGPLYSQRGVIQIS